MMVRLGKASDENARVFCSENPEAILGSLTANGSRRVSTTATGNALDLIRTRFVPIAVDEVPQVESVVLQNITPPSCIHRGSQRKTCCGSPDMWICRELKTDCVASSVDAANLRRMVATTEAASIAVCETCPHRKEVSAVQRQIPISTETTAVVIPCHDYARFLDECLQSVLGQTVGITQIIVVDDSSDDDPKSVCDKYPQVQYTRCDVRDVHKARSHALQFVQSNYVAFLDADDKLPARYFAEALEIFRQDRRVAITYPKLEYFGDATGPAHGTDRSLPELRGDDIEQRNWIGSGSVIRTELLHQSLGFRREIDPTKNWSQDWQIAKAVLRSGNWVARKMQTPLMYRKHGLNMSGRPNDSYWNDADFANETVTIVIAFSGRWDAWPKLLAWLRSQTWPVEQVNLLIMNSTHAPLTVAMLGLEDWQGGICIDRLNVGYPRLADKDRRNQLRIGKAVEAAVAGLYNRVTTLLGTEYAIFVEDDVVPHDLNLVEKMFRRMGAWVAGVSGVYRQRYQTDKCCAFDVPYEGDQSFKSLFGTGIERVGGTGFGCLMTRRSMLRRFPLAGDGPGRFFDTAFALEVKQADGGYWQWLLDRDIQADHLLSDNLERTSVNLSGQ